MCYHATSVQRTVRLVVDGFCVPHLDAKSRAGDDKTRVLRPARLFLCWQRFYVANPPVSLLYGAGGGRGATNMILLRRYVNNFHIA